MELDDPKLEMEVQMGLTAALAANRYVLLPKVRYFTQLFGESRVVLRERRYSYQSLYVVSWDLEGGGECHLDSCCEVRGTVSYTLDVTPFDDVTQIIEDNMIREDGYVYRFEIIVRDNGTALVLIKYDRILGDRWLAIIDASSIPNYDEAQRQVGAAESEEDEEEDEDEDAASPAETEPVTLGLFGAPQ